MNTKAAEDMKNKAEEVKGYEVLINAVSDYTLTEADKAEFINRARASNFQIIDYGTNNNTYFSAVLHIEARKTEAERERAALVESLETMDTNALDVSELMEIEKLIID